MNITAVFFIIMMIGIVVDTVTEVQQISGQDIEDKPAGIKYDMDYFILGMAKIEKGVMTLLDIDELLMGEDTSWLDKAA